MTRVVDFFPYYNPTGRQVTELRIRMWEDFVDEFVICESNMTHSGLPAEQGLESLIEEANLPREKIRIIRLNIPEELPIERVDYANCYGGNHINPRSVAARCRERLQKDSILRVIDDYDYDTMFIVSDQDEIINPLYFAWLKDTVRRIPQCVVKVPLVHLEGRADLRVHMRDTGLPKPWDTPVCVVMKHHLKMATPIGFRSCLQSTFPTTYLTLDGKRVEDMGWHFSWMGGAKERLAKLEGFAHYADKFDFLPTGSYESEETKDALITLEPKDGGEPPSCNATEVLRSYPHEELPKMLFELPRVKEYLLP